MIDFIIMAFIGGAIVGAFIWLLGRGMRLLFPPKTREEKDPVAEQLKASAEWMNGEK